MAVVPPFMAMPSPGGLQSAFSPFTDSPSSPLIYQTGIPGPDRTSASSDSLAPPASPYPQQVDPSPTDSNGTESTDIEEDAQEHVEKQPQQDVETQTGRPQSRDSLVRLNTTINVRSRSNSDEAPSSVIHAPPGYGEFKTPLSARSETQLEKSRLGRATSSMSPSTPDAALGPDDKRMSSGMSPLNTDIAPEKGIDRSTPQAQTRQEVEEEWRRRSRRTSSLEDIPEMLAACPPADSKDSKISNDRDSETSEDLETNELRVALKECWTLCNTLSNLSSHHRKQMFTTSSRDGFQEYAWRSCWRLCQQLYQSQDQTQSHTLPTLELCRDFCQALFDVRQKGDEASDSVLRVSFEMNNHLYNTHDRNLPLSFRERTLDFYVTLCHRLMKQRTAFVHETDVLLMACWALAESLFSLRQTGRDLTRPYDELLASAVQACWDLSDLFREGWSQIRPERSTPRPGQASFPASVKQHSTTHLSERASSSLSSEYHDAPSLPPETPTTIFDDATTVSSPESSSGNIPHILVLGPASNAGVARGVSSHHHERWSSNASTLSDHSESVETSSQRTSSTARGGSDNANLFRLHCLILKAALNSGFERDQPLAAFVKTLHPGAFGAQPWQQQLLKNYKRLVAADQSLRAAATIPSRRLSNREVAKAVVWLSRNEDWAWIRDLYRLVVGFAVEEVGSQGGNLHI